MFYTVNILTDNTHMSKNTLLIACALLISTGVSMANIKPKSIEGQGVIRTTITYFEGTKALRKVAVQPESGATVTTPDGARWALDMTSTPVEGQSDATDYTLTWSLVSGEARHAAVSVEFPFSEWSSDNYVFVPASVYDGNRFAVKHINYPPYWYDKSEWRLDMPTTTTVQPTLGTDPDTGGKIELTTGSASTPMMAFHSPKQQAAWMVMTTQGSELGNHGMFIEESAGRKQAQFSIMAPAIREQMAAMGGFVASGDEAANWKTGDKATIRFRLYAFGAPTLNDMMQRFLDVRKDLNTAERREELPFSEGQKLISNLYQEHRWDPAIEMYWLSEVTTNSPSWNFVWQLGWCGGGQCTLPMIMQGSETIKERAKSNLDVIFTKSQAPSGFFNAYGNGREFVSFGYGAPLKNNETLVRSQGDWLYMSQRQFNVIKEQGGSIPAHWTEGTHKLAEAFARLWDKYGQFGQFVDVQTGDICIGGSTSGAIAVGGMALASKTYDDPRYLKIAKEAARKFHRDFILKGYTTGGPGEILSTPDSESAFGLFEGIMALYEVTGEREWLEYAADLLPICASWTVSYDFRFPEKSAMGAIDARSCGSVWASVANKHSAPGICTWSGDSFLKYYRATRDARALELVTDIAHGLPQYISRDDRPVGNMPAGGVCERVNTSDWEGKGNIGGSIFGSCSWVEATSALTFAQIPGLYVEPDTGIFAAFDNIKAEKISHSKGKLTLRLSNPTKFVAEVSTRSESSKKGGKGAKMGNVVLQPGQSMEVTF